MITIDKDKWSNFLKKFHRESIIFNKQEKEVIDNLINKGNEIDNILFKLDFGKECLDFEKYAKKVILYKELQNDVINDIIQYEKDVIQFYKDEKIKQGHNIWKTY